MHIALTYSKVFSEFGMIVYYAFRWYNKLLNLT